MFTPYTHHYTNEEIYNTNDKNTGSRALAGTAALIVFIALVLVAAIAAAVILDVGGVLEQQAGETGTDSSDQLSSQLSVLSTVGTISDEDDDDPVVDEISMTVAASPGASDLNLEEATIEVVNSNGAETLTVGDFEEGEEDEPDQFAPDASEEEFGIIEIESDSDFPLITAPEDRHELIVDFDDDDALDNLVEGENVEMTIVTGPGGQTYESVTIPSTLSGDDETVNL